MSAGISSIPILILFPHARCNCRCVMCDIWKTAAKDEISPEDIVRRLPELERLGVRRVVLSGGEPLLHSRFGDLCAPLRGAGIGVTLLTTGLLLAEKKDLVGRYVDEVVVSLDGPREIHDRIRRVPRAFDRLAEGVRAVREFSPAIRITARSVVQLENFRHLRETVEAARQIGFEQISFLAADVSTDAFNRPGGWDREHAALVSIPPSEIPSLEAEIENLISDAGGPARAGFIAERPEKLRRIARHFAALAGLVPHEAPRCNAPWVSAVVEADGSVRPCFFHPAYQPGTWSGRELPAILDSGEARSFRDRLDVASNETCRRCVCALYLEDEERAALNRGARATARDISAPSS